MKKLKDNFSVAKVNSYIHSFIDKYRSLIKSKLIASEEESEPAIVRKKHIRLGYMVAFCVIIVLCIAAYITTPSTFEQLGTIGKTNSKQDNKSSKKKIEINKLAKGVDNEKLWIEGVGREVEKLKSEQQRTELSQGSLKSYVDKEKVSKAELEQIINNLKDSIEQKYEEKLQQELQNISKANQMRAGEAGTATIEVAKPIKRKKSKKIGKYVPAGSYVPAKMISGVDAGVGINAAGDPRQVMLRITGDAVSAGFGKNYLTSNKLIGCIVQCQAVGDISSEKVYLKPVLMTCAKDRSTVLELPVKGFVTSSGKSGIRGEVVSREADLVTQSFLAGLVGGIGNGVSQISKPEFAISGGMAIQGKSKEKNIAMSGLGTGVSNASNKISDYLIKRAEQYQPVISINEGVEVSLVFQEGVNLEEEEDE